MNYSKAQAVLFGQWGFQQQHGKAQGIAALFHGVPGTGKTLAAEAVGFDIGRPLMVVNCAQLIDKYVGESAKNIEKVFEEAKAQATRCHCHRLHHSLCRRRFSSSTSPKGSSPRARATAGPRRATTR